jgi:hypothetical protein
MNDAECRFWHRTSSRHSEKEWLRIHLADCERIRLTTALETYGMDSQRGYLAISNLHFDAHMLVTVAQCWAYTSGSL